MAVSPWSPPEVTWRCLRVALALPLPGKRAICPGPLTSGPGALPPPPGTGFPVGVPPVRNSTSLAASRFDDLGLSFPRGWGPATADAGGVIGPPTPPHAPDEVEEFRREFHRRLEAGVRIPRPLRDEPLQVGAPARTPAGAESRLVEGPATVLCGSCDKLGKVFTGVGLPQFITGFQIKAATDSEKTSKNPLTAVKRDID